MMDDVDASLQSPLSRHLKPVRSHVVRAAPTLGLPLTAQTQGGEDTGIQHIMQQTERKP